MSRSNKRTGCPLCGEPSCIEYACKTKTMRASSEGRSKSEISTTPFLTDEWTPGRWEADDAVMATKSEATARTQQTLRTDPMFAGHTRAERASMMGTRLRLDWYPNTALLGLKVDDPWAYELADLVEDVWYAYMECPVKCWADASGHNTFTGLMGLLRYEFVGTGESANSFERVPDPDNIRPFPTAMSVIDSSRIDTPPDFIGNPSVKHGRRVNSFGSVSAYYIADEHPTSMYRFSEMAKRKSGSRAVSVSVDGKSSVFKKKKPYTTYKPFYSWGKPRFVHYFDRTRAGQNRGLPEIAPALPHIKAFSQLTEVAYQAAYRDAVFAMWMQSIDPAIGQTYANNSSQDPVALYLGMHGAHQELSEIHQNTMGAKLNGRTLVPLMPGTEIHSSRGGFDKNGQREFNHSLLSHVCAAANIDLPSYTGDWSQTNFSSARTGIISTFITRLHMASQLIQAHGGAFFDVFFEEMVAAGVFRMPISSNRTRAHLNYYYQNREAFRLVRFITPGREHIDEVKGVKAAIARITNGLGNRRQYFSDHSQQTYREHLRDIARDKRHEELYGVEYGSGDDLPDDTSDRDAQDDSDDIPNEATNDRETAS